jgi:glycerate kinase
VRIVVAPDKFKGSLSAAAVARAVAAGIARVRPDAEVDCVPLADGGDGTVDAAVAAGYDRVPARVTGPTGEPVESSYARRGDRAVVELADVCGLARLPGGRLAPLDASTRGLGEMIARAVADGARTVVLGVGGSASTDGGAGMLQGLGAAVLEADGRPVGPGGRGLAAAATLDLSDVRRRLTGVRIELAADVDNPLLGPHGAAAVYGPQKGATPDDVPSLDRALARWAAVVAAATGVDRADAPGAGAAGGVGFAALAGLGARRRSGIDVLAEVVGLADRLAGADLVITGEGSLDAQTLRGKTVAGVARLAAERGVPVRAVAGVVALSPDDQRRLGVTRAIGLAELEPDRRRCFTEAESLLARAAARLLDDELAD